MMLMVVNIKVQAVHVFLSLNYTNQNIGKSIMYSLSCRYYGGMTLCCIVLLVVLFGLLGLCFGVCGDSSGEDAPACNRGIGGTILML